MIVFRNVDITSFDFGVIGHQVNCCGKMNSGVAKSIRHKWPIIYQQYLSFSENKKASSLLGECQIVSIHDNLAICNIYGQQNYGYLGGKYTDIEALEKGLTTMYQYAVEQLLPIYLPKIGSGRGGADWETEVLPILQRLDENGPKLIPIFVCHIDENSCFLKQ